MSWRDRLIEGLLWTGLGVLLLTAFFYHSAHTTFPYQLMGSEAVQLQTTRALLMGLDPWDVPNAFDYSNDYGVVYPAVAALLRPLAPGYPLLVHLRLLSAAAAFLALGLLFLQLRREGASVLEAAAASAAVYAGLLYYDTLCARPDGLAVALYLAAIFWAAQPGGRNAAIGGVVAAIGFFAKPYVVLAVPVAWVLLVAQRRMSDSLSLLLGAAIGGLCLGLAVHAWSPHYFEGTYFIHLHAASYSVAHLLRQCRELARDHWPLLAALIAAGALVRWHRPEPLAVPGLRPWAWAVAAVFAILALGPGGHAGAFMRYFQQLFLPLAILVCVLALTRAGVPRRLRIALLIADGIVMMGVNGRAYPLIPPVHAQEWRAIEEWIGRHPYSLVPPVLLSVAVGQGAFVFDNDNNGYASTLTPPGPIRDDAVAREKKVAEDLAAGRFDSVISARARPELLKHYRQAPDLCAYTPIGWQCFVVYERIAKAKPRQ